ncbi:adenylate/guanylate cyclase domain-containing protein [Prochlorothrix hollandica]|uniref:adenylate/guanylate cyclase domain-containing protein n=1 Tax=Prochlorothrix hollandica TaxID=1223 RepID=UPI00035DCFBA|nr:adenylate/guanylate cyclase domain-containing protein [Prochlorothrix hollandica]
MVGLAPQDDPPSNPDRTTMGISIRTFITLPFVILTLVPASLVGALAYHNSHRAVEALAETLMDQISDRVRQQLRTYLATSHFINQSAGQAIESGRLRLDQPRILEQHFAQEFQAAFASSPVLQASQSQHDWSRSLNHIYLGTPTDLFVGAEYRPRLSQDPNSKRIIAISRADASTGQELLQYASDDQGRSIGDPLDPPTGKPYYPTRRPWYQRGMVVASEMAQAQGPPGGWSSPYCDRTTASPVITAVRPIVINGQVRGVLGSDFLFSDVGDFLGDLLQQLQVGQGGEIFVVSGDGELLVSSNETLDDCDPDGGTPVTRPAATLTDSIISTLVTLSPPDRPPDRPNTALHLEQSGQLFWTSWPFEEHYGLRGTVYIVIPRSYFMGTIDRGNQITFLLCALSLAIALLFSLGIAGRIATPIVQLEEATQHLIEAVNNDGEIKRMSLAKNPFELYRLGQSFETMSFQLRDSFIAFSHFVPYNFLQALGHKRPMDVRLGDSQLLPMTVLFSDIRSFTKISERLTAAETFRFINGYLSHMEPAIVDQGGFIDKYIGDAIMALFNGDHSPDRAVAAGLAMVRQLASYNELRQSQYLEPIGIGIGIHTGWIALGTLGGEKRWDTTVMGSDVNRASRIEGLTKDFQVNLIISGSTLKQLQQSYDHRYLAAAKVRGVEEPVDIYEVYAADPPALRHCKQMTIAPFKAGVIAYQAQDYSTALACFETVLEQTADVDPTLGDRPAQFYRDRCREHLSGDLQQWARSLDSIA